MQIKSLCSLAVMALFAGCGGGGGSDGGTSPQPVEPVAKKAPALCPTNDNGANYDCPAMSGFNGDESTTISTQGNARVERIEFAQLHLKQPDSQYFVAVANRDALIRVVVTADAGQNNLKAPALKLTLTNQDTGVQVMQTTLHPATSQMVLPITGDAVDAARGNTTVPDFYRSYLYRLPAANLPAANLPAANLQLKAEIDTIASGLQDSVFIDNAKVVNLKPVAVPTLKLVTVPIQVSGTVPKMPNPDFIRKLMSKYLPISDVQIRQHEPFIVADWVFNGVKPADYQGGWFVSLGRINWDTQGGEFALLPQQESNNSEHYVGFVNGRAGGSTNPQSGTIVMQDELAYEPDYAVLPHEFLHVLNFPHDKACGATLGLDQPDVYPYPNGGLGGVWGIEINENATRISLKSPAKYSSLMGYCVNRFTSDYHAYEFVNRFRQ